MAILSPFTYLQWFDGSGSPLANGKIYSYEAGTSTPKITYTDSSGGTPHTNPIILDSAGRTQIWLDSGAYKFIVKTSAEALIETIDNIIGSSSSNVQGFVNTISELRALSSGAFETVAVTGYYADSDGGEGNFYWDDSSSLTDDTGTVIQPNSTPANGRWRRYITNGKHSPAMFASAAFFLIWATAQTTNRSIVIDKNLDLNGATASLNTYIDIVQFNDSAKISNGILTISKMSAFPIHQIFDSTATITFASGATRFANITWFGVGETARAKLITAFPNGGVQFVDDLEPDEKRKLKYIGTDGIVYDLAMFNYNETFE